LLLSTFSLIPVYGICCPFARQSLKQPGEKFFCEEVLISGLGQELYKMNPRGQVTNRIREINNEERINTKS
jgi:hypothetical protein